MGLRMERRPLSAEDVRLALKEYEAAYGVASSERHTAFTDESGVLRESDDWRTWDALWAVWTRAFHGSSILA